MRDVGPGPVGSTASVSSSGTVRSLNPNSVPPPGGLATHMWPPIASARLVHTKSPIPEPATVLALAGSR